MVNQLFRAYVLAFALLRRGVQVSPDPCEVNRLISKLRRRGRRGTPVKKGCYNLAGALWGGARDFDSNFLEISGGLTGFSVLGHQQKSRGFPWLSVVKCRLTT